MSKPRDRGAKSWQPTHDATRQFLSRCDLFQNVPNYATDQLSQMAVPQGLSKGETLWREGDTSHFVIVWRGQLEVRKHGGLIDIMLPFQALGHSALLGKAHTATICAAVDSHLLCFEGAQVLEMTRNCFPLIIAVLADSLALVSKLNADLQSSKWPLLMRLCHRLRWLSRGKKAVSIDITHKQLAELTGSTKWSVSRELKKLEEIGAIRQRFKQIELVDLDPLKIQRLSEPESVAVR